MPSEGLGSTLADNTRILSNGRACRKQIVEWRAPSREEAAKWDAHPIARRFADDTVAVAEIEGREWVVRERVWFGFPDPPQYILFVFENDVAWAATDFDNWPRRWTRPF